MQRSAGNAAVSSLLQRSSGHTADTAQRAPNGDTEVADSSPPPGESEPQLRSSLLAGNPRIEAAVRNAQPLESGEESDGVRLLQEGLSQVGLLLPGSQRPDGSFDGIFGPETTRVVRQFQVEHDVNPPGGWEAGHKTLTRLDQLLTSPPSPTPSATRSLLVDDISQTEPGQMQVGVFLASLRGAVTSEVTELFVGTPFRVADCPFIPKWFDFYGTQDASHVEQAVRHFGGAPALAATNAGVYMQLAVQRVAVSVRTWLDSGRLVGVPDEIDPAVPGEDANKNFDNATNPGLGAGGDQSATDIGTAPTQQGTTSPSQDSVPSATAPLGPARSTDPLQDAVSLGGANAQLKARPGGRRPAHPRVSSSPTTAGDRVPRASGDAVRAAFGFDTSDVRLHHGTDAHEVADRLDARAVTAGSDVYFGAGEYRPGTLMGDALLAHELAHAAQQAAGANDKEQAPTPSTDPLETEADDLALKAVAVSRFGVDAVAPELLQQAGPRLKSGLRLQSCKRSLPNDKLSTGGPEISTSQEAMGKLASTGMEAANQKMANNANSEHPGSGIFYAFQPAGRDFPNGHADDDYFKSLGFMHWQLNSGRSAATGIRKWLAGPTVAECWTTVEALKYDAIRAAIGDKQFDIAFGRGDGVAPTQGTLEINVPPLSAVPLGKFINKTDGATAADQGTRGHRPVKEGEWYYFRNHPDYLKKHPAGAFQGENALFAGTVNGIQFWTGLGEDDLSEDQMLDAMVGAFNNGRTASDKKRLISDFGSDETKWPPVRDQITKDELLAAGGGLSLSSGQDLDLAKVSALK